MSLRVIQIKVGGYDENFSYVIFDTNSKEAGIVDPSGDIEKVFEAVEKEKLKVTMILVTHTHFDHIDKLDVILEMYPNLPIYVHELGVGAVSNRGESEESKGPERSKALHDGSEIALGQSSVTVMHTPGHIDDAVCFYIDNTSSEDGIPKVITGDTLFVEGCGRTNTQEVRNLYKSLQKLRTLPDETEVFPGHDYGSKPHSTIGYEKTHNRYYLAENFEAFRDIRL